MRLLFVGDVMLGRLVNDRLRDVPPEYPWGDSLWLIREADVRVANLECVIAEDGEAASKEFTFRSDAKNVAVLETAGVNLVSLANNHTLDFGPDALGEMLATLDRAHIAHAGAGRTLEEARAVARLTLDGASAGMLSVTDNEPEWEAGMERPGTWFVPIVPDDTRAKELLARVEAAKRDAGILIVSLHWGTNWGREPEPSHREFAHALIDAGADIVFGHSSHVFRGIEIYAGGLILFGAGNFIDDYAIDDVERNDESFIYSVEVDDARLARVRLYPTVIEGFAARLADAARGRVIAARMEELCERLGTKMAWVEREGALEAVL